MKCPECGYELKPDDLKEGNVCPECGTQLPDDFVSLVVNSDNKDENEKKDDIKVEELDDNEVLEEIEEELDENGRGKGKSSIKILIIIIVGLIIAGGASFFFIIKPMLIKEQTESIPDTNLVEEFPFDTTNEEFDTSEVPFDTTNVDTSFLQAGDTISNDTVNTKQNDISDTLADTSEMKKDSLKAIKDTTLSAKTGISNEKDTSLVKDTTKIATDSLKVSKVKKVKKGTSVDTTVITKKDTTKVVKNIVKKVNKNISKRKVSIRKRTVINRKKKKVIIPKKKKVDYTKIYPYKGIIKLTNGRTIKDRIKMGSKYLKYITFTSDKIQKIPFKDVLKIKLFYEGPIYLSDNSYITKVTATVFLKDGTRMNNIILTELPLKTMKNGSFLIVNNYKVTRNINSIKEIFFNKE